MKQKLFVVSFLVATLIILTSLTSVVGVQTTKTEDKYSSPLFSKRLTTMMDKDNEEIESNYIGKGTTLNLFSNKRSYMGIWMDKAIRIIQTNPAIIDSIFARVEKIPYIMNLLKENGISKTDLTKYSTQLKNNPSLIEQESDLIQINLEGGDTPVPKGLSTSNPIGCLVTVIALLPLVIVLAVLIGTITIITCLNIGGCLETLMENIYNSILQELMPA